MLDLGQVEALTETLGELPVIRKLDLRGNDLTARVRTCIVMRVLCISHRLGKLYHDRTHVRT